MKTRKVILIISCIVGLILLIAALLMPSLSRVREQSKSAAERARLKQDALYNEVTSSVSAPQSVTEPASTDSSSVQVTTTSVQSKENVALTQKPVGDAQAGDGVVTYDWNEPVTDGDSRLIVNARKLDGISQETVDRLSANYSGGYGGDGGNGAYGGGMGGNSVHEMCRSATRISCPRCYKNMKLNNKPIPSNCQYFSDVVNNPHWRQRNYGSFRKPKQLVSVVD